MAALEHLNWLLDGAPSGFDCDCNRMRQRKRALRRNRSLVRRRAKLKRAASLPAHSNRLNGNDCLSHESDRSMRRGGEGTARSSACRVTAISQCIGSILSMKSRRA